MEPIRVLLVEDDPLVAELVALGLGAEYVCEHARAARAALQLAARTAPAAVILDLRLRGGDGLELLAALRRQPATAAVPVIIFSSSADQPAVGTRLAAMAAGPVARVPKAAGVHGLRKVLADMLHAP